MTLVREMKFALTAWMSSYPNRAFIPMVEAVAWQMRCERKRWGTRFVVTDVSLHGTAWLAEGFELFDKMTPTCTSRVFSCCA